MKDYERDFVFRIQRLAISGPDFASIVKETLRDTLGEAGSSVALHGVRKDVLERPDRLAEELSRIFGSGAIPILKTIVVSALVDTKESTKGESQPEFPMIPATIEERYGIRAVREVYLHDHRMKDEMDEYFENLDESKSD
jgi:hypothetical protein